MIKGSPYEFSNYPNDKEDINTQTEKENARTNEFSFDNGKPLVAKVNKFITHIRTTHKP